MYYITEHVPLYWKIIFPKKHCVILMHQVDELRRGDTNSIV